MKFLGYILIIISFSVMIYDEVTNRFRKVWEQVFMLVTFITGVFLIDGIAKGVSSLYVYFLVSFVMVWIERLYIHINKKKLISKTGIKRFGLVVIVSILLLEFFRQFLFPSIRLFLDHIRIFISIPKFVSVFLTFGVVYFVTIFIFGSVYATLHLYYQEKGFTSSSRLSLRDFYFFSALNIATQGYKNMVPNHWLIVLISIFQIIAGIVLLGVYLAGAFTYIVVPN